MAVQRSAPIITEEEPIIANGSVVLNLVVPASVQQQMLQMLVGMLVDLIQPANGSESDSDSEEDGNEQQ